LRVKIGTRSGLGGGGGKAVGVKRGQGNLLRWVNAESWGSKLRGGFRLNER